MIWRIKPFLGNTTDIIYSFDELVKLNNQGPVRSTFWRDDSTELEIENFIRFPPTIKNKFFIFL